MSYYDSEPTLKIGSSYKKAGEQPRERTVKGNAALNAAYRNGNVTTEKKYATPNQSGSNPEGQLMTKVDRSDDIVKPKVIEDHIVKNIKAARSNSGITQKELATRSAVPVVILQQIESGKALAKDANPVIPKLQRVLGGNLRAKKPPAK
ncbi:hypothetical protein MYU51_005491 [Penicillium brevicompactum]